MLAVASSASRPGRAIAWGRFAGVMPNDCTAIEPRVKPCDAARRGGRSLRYAAGRDKEESA